MSRYYTFNPDEIGDLSLYQFQKYLDDIVVIEGLFYGTKPKLQQEKVEDNNLLIGQAKALGLKTPSKIVG